MTSIFGDNKSTGKSGWLHVFDICAYVHRLGRAQAGANRGFQQKRFKQPQVHRCKSEQVGATGGGTLVPAPSIPGSPQNISTHLSHAGAAASQSRVLLLRPPTASTTKANEAQPFASGLCALRAESANEAQGWVGAVVPALGEPLAHCTACRVARTFYCEKCTRHCFHYVSTQTHQQRPRGDCDGPALLWDAGARM